MLMGVMSGASGGTLHARSTAGVNESSLVGSVPEEFPCEDVKAD
jgi:hypothetical protein